MAVVIILITFGPLHSLQTTMLVELASPVPDGQRVGELNQRAFRWLMGMTDLVLVVIAMMTGLRGFLTTIG